VLDRIRPQGETAVLDGVYVALAATLANTGRSLVVVYTDGTDTRSWLQPEEVLDSAKRSSAVIYAVTADARHWAALEGLTDATGGQMIRVAPGGDLREVFDRILREFRSRYVLTYTPRGVPPGGFHRLEVRAKRRGLTVKARTSYMGVGPEK
jgi:VWFA-related protein